MKIRNTAVIALGANLGSKDETLVKAARQIADLTKADKWVLSSLYETEPIESSGPDYVNAVMLLETEQNYREIFKVLQKTEQDFGRIRPQGVVNAPRTIDCDFLLFNDEQVAEPDLLIPHPRMHERAFVLVPLAEVAREINIPGKGRISDFLPLVQDQRIKIFKKGLTMSNESQRKKVTLRTLQKMKAEGIPIAMLTCYDASFATLEDGAGVDIMLVGDSLGMTIQGKSSTLDVSQRDMEYHTRCVAKGNKTAFIMTDMSFGTYQCGEDEAVANAVRLMQAGANMVKLEGGEELAPLIRRLCRMGVPVCAHLGFTPQSVNTIGGFLVQGRGEQAERLRKTALALQDAGAAIILFEMVPAPIAEAITNELTVPTIGIGAGIGCSGQVLVLHDILGIYPNRQFRFARNFLQGAGSIQEAVGNYVKAVKEQSFPALENSFME